MQTVMSTANLPAALIAGHPPSHGSAEGTAEDTAGDTADDARRLARTAGFKDSALPHLEDVDRRRTQLWGLSLLVALVVPIVLLMSGLQSDEGPLSQALADRTVRLGLLAMMVCVMGYIAEREVTLRRLTALLMGERALTVSLVGRVEELNLMLRATRAMNSALDIEAVLSQIAASAHTLLRACGATILLVDPDHPGRLMAGAATGWTVSDQDRQARTEGLAADAAFRGESLLVTADLSMDGQVGQGDTLIIPMEVRGSLVGVLTVAAGPDREPFTEYDLRSLNVFGDAAAAAISNARAYTHKLEQVASLLEQDRAKDEFLTLVTHELRTPLTSMIGLMSTMARRGDQMESQQIVKCAEIARGQGWRLDRLIENLLESSRSLDGALSITTRPADVSQEVHDAVVGLQRALPNHKINLSVQAGMHREVDVDAMLRILDNLLSNAAKYCPDGTAVHVTVRESSNGIAMSVADSGPGIDADGMQALFDKFTRGPDPFDRGGLGLGLYVVQALAEAHGGRVEVSATAGGGATFTVYLAAARVDQPVA